MRKRLTPTLETFMFSAVHDIKNSIAVLAASLEHILASEPEKFATVGQMFYEVKRINCNLTHMLTLYKFGLSSYPIDIQENHLRTLLAESIMPHQSLLDSKSIEVEIETDADLSWPLDEYLISSVIGHAVNNAIKYTQDRIRVSAYVTSKGLEIRIEDNGKGYPPAMLNHSAEEICEGDRSFNGTGLGLYFSEEVARVHKHGRKRGTVHLENGGKFGGGCFVVNIP